MIIEIIGLPCSGKTYLINEFLKRNPTWFRIDISEYIIEEEDGTVRHDFNELRDDLEWLKSSGKNVIIESVTGFGYGKFVIKVTPDDWHFRQFHSIRKVPVTNQLLDHYSILQNRMIDFDKLLVINKEFHFDDFEEIINDACWS